MNAELRARVLAELAKEPLGFFTLSGRLIVPFSVDAHEGLRAVFCQLIEENAIAPVPTASTLPPGPLTALYRIAA